MSHPSPKAGLSRRRLLAAGLQVGVGSLLLGSTGCGPPEAPLPAYRPRVLPTALPTRTLGRAGQRIPILTLGAQFLVPGNTTFLRRILAEGVVCWETAVDYQQGNSERAIGEYLTRFPEDREKLFLVTKNVQPGDDLDAALDLSLAQLCTDHVDLYLVHGASKPRQVGTSARRWAARQKSSGRVRLFGFAAHENMTDMLRFAADTDWIDAAMVSYNHRLAEDAAQREAMDDCAARGVGLLTMKTHALLGAEPAQEQDLARAFAGRPRSLFQARLAAVWENPAVTTVCTMMKNTEELLANVGACRDGAGLDPEERAALRAHAALTAPAYCSACGRCRAATGRPVPDVLRCLMYHHGYGEPDRARRVFAALVRAEDLAGVDFAAAEATCPQRIPIGHAMREAARLLG